MNPSASGQDEAAELTSRMAASGTMLEWDADALGGPVTAAVFGEARCDARQVFLGSGLGPVGAGFGDMPDLSMRKRMVDYFASL